MRTFVLILFFFSLHLGFSQVAPEPASSSNADELVNFELSEPAGYILDKQEFTFTPEEHGIRIRKVQDITEVDYGNLRQTGDEGLYVLTSPLYEDVAFGRFDADGNFRSLRYDPKQDSVMEEHFKRKSIRKKK